MTPPSRVARASNRKRRQLLLTLVLAVIALIAVFGAAWLWVGQRPPVREVASQSGEVKGLLDLVTVGGRPGAPPVVGVPAPVEVGSLKVAEVEAGTGRVIEENRPVAAQVHRFSGRDGRALDSGKFVMGQACADDLGPELSHLVMGRTEGTRLLVLRPVGDDTEVVIVDLLPTVATGTEVGQQDGPLSVALNAEGPVITHRPGEPPANLVVQQLLRGDGPQVHMGDQVLAQFLLARWGDGVVVTNTWGEGLPQVNEVDELWPGLRDALVDQRVGSRIAVTIPADLANGDDTIVAVIDILGTITPSD